MNVGLLHIAFEAEDKGPFVLFGFVIQKVL